MKLFDDLPREHGFEPLRVEGTLPADLRGTLYRCGPALASCFGHRYQHLFDGDGAVTAIHFSGGSARGAVRVVETPGLVEERAARRAIHPAYGTLPPGPPRPLPRPKHAANISVLAARDHVLALHEAGAPIELDRELATRGELDLGEPSVHQGFSAHPHAVAERGTHYNFGVHYGRTTTLALFELRDRTARRLGGVELAGPTMIHDFAATPRHLVFFAPPLRLDVRAFATGLASYSDALAWEPRHGTEILVVPIDDPAACIRFTVDPFFQWHVVQAHDAGSELVVDLVRYADFASNRWIGALGRGERHAHAPGRLCRARIDLAGKHARFDDVCDTSLEFALPYGDGKVIAIAHRDSTLHEPFDRIVQIDTASGRVDDVALPAGQLPSETLVVRGHERDWLLSLVYDANRHASHVAVIDRATLEVVARAWFDHHIPFTLHGTWLAD